MSENREFYAANVEEAVAKAAQDLGVNAEDVSYRVVDSGNSGFLGIGARDARIEVELTSAPDAGEAETAVAETPTPPKRTQNTNTNRWRRPATPPRRRKNRPPASPRSLAKRGKRHERAYRRS